MSKSPNILILYPVEDDPQSLILYEEVVNKGGRPLFLPFKMKKGKDAIPVSISKESVLFSEDLSDIKAVFIRGVSVDVPLMAPPYLGELEMQLWKARYLKENQRIFTVNQIIKALERKGALVANPLRTYMHHNTKVQLAALLRKHGLSMPATYGTNHSHFLDRKIKSAKDYVMKSSCGVGATRLINEKHLNRSAELHYCPALIQEKIEGHTLRVHTVGDKAILSLRIFATDVDSRSDTAGFEVIELNPEHEKMIIAANELLGLHFSAWDVIVDNKGRLHLLDCNPGPYIFWIGNYFTRVFLAEVAKYLVAFAETGSINHANNATKRAEPLIGKIQCIDEDAMPYVEHLLHVWKTPLGQRH